MFVLTDQFLADSYRSVVPFDVDALSPVAFGVNAKTMASSPYQRFAITQDGISPRLAPGTSQHLVVVDSDEHTEDGHITEDLSVRTKMVEKRLRKGEGIYSQVVAPDFQGGNESYLLLVSWGSSRGAVREAAALMEADGDSVATLHFSQVWPMVPDQFMEHFGKARDVICIEGNALGQLSRLIRRETGFHIKKRIHRYDGLPLTPEFILRELNP
jgi:2-oxoglutarate ferredoxin oxidoreductase subunit alpha